MPEDPSQRKRCPRQVYYASPAYQAGWDEATQIRREVSFTKGRIIVRGKLVSRGEGKQADYVLHSQAQPPHCAD